jgi:hypothetical protein
MDREGDLYTLYRAAHRLGNGSKEITDEDVAAWAAGAIKVAIEYYDSEVADCPDPDCDICESMQKLGYFLDGLVKRPEGKYNVVRAWETLTRRRYRRLRIGHALGCPCSFCTAEKEVT